MTLPTQRTWADIVEYASEFDKREGAVPNRALYLLLGNEALAIMGEAAQVRRGVWDNAADGELTLSGNTAGLPADCLAVESVEWDGAENQLELAAVEWLDEHETGWRTNTGEPNRYAIEGSDLVLNAAPTGTTTGKLVIRGWSVLEFSDAAGAENPLADLPLRFQMLPALYIIAKLPALPARPQGETESAWQWASAETQRRTAARAEARAEWERGLEELRSATRRRRMRPFVY